jgi:plasmid stabilization system protein ParE
MLSVVRTDQAETDLAEILDYVEERSPQAAERLARAIDDRCTPTTDARCLASFL